MNQPESRPSLTFAGRSHGRVLIGASALALMGCAGACKKDAPDSEAPTLSDAPKPAEVAPAPMPAREPVELIRWSADLRDLAGTLSAGETLLAQLRPGTPINLRAVVESIAMQAGLGKTWTDALDWKGRFAIDLAYPQPGQTHALPEDLQLRANLAALDANAALLALPEHWSPTQVSPGEFSATREEVQLEFRALSDQLLVGRSRGDLDAAVAMAQRAAPRRVEIHAENLHAGDVDPKGLLAELPSGLTGPIAAALERAQSLDFSLDLGRDIDLAAHLRVQADLSGFGFDPLGTPRTQTSPVADRLPPNAVAMALMSWGDPALIHRELDRYAGMIPEPFDKWVAEVIAGSHAVLDQVSDEVVVGLWMDDKGQAALVIAGRVKDNAAGKAAVRRVLAGAHALGERYLGLMGDDRDYRAKLEYKIDGLGFSKAKADLLSTSVPRAFVEDAKRVAMFVGHKKPKLEILSLVEGEIGVVILGAGARGIMSDYVRSLGGTRRMSAETDHGLSMARAVGGGCQLCLSVEPLSALRTYLQHRADFNDDASALSTRAKLDSLTARGPVALSLRAGDTEAALGIAASHSLLFDPPALVPELLRVMGLLPAPGPTP